MPIDRIVGEIERGLDILSSRLHNVPERHRSMRAVFEYSWQLLSSEERNSLKQLTVFRGSFDQEAAEQVAKASLLHLALLVEKSLLRVTESGRYTLHELLRQFAAEKLVANWSDEALAHERHSAYYQKFLKAREQKLVGPEQRRVLAEINQDVENIRRAWQWALAQHNLAAIHEMSETIYNFYQIRSRYQEGQEIFANAVAQLQQALSLAEQPLYELTLARLMAQQGAFFYWLGDYDAADRQLQASLQAAVPQRERAFSHQLFGKIARLQGRKAEAEAQLGQALALSREAGDLNGAAEALLGLAEVAGSFSDYAAGKAWAGESLALFRQLQRPDRIAQALGSLAWSMACLGAYAEAEAHYRESLAICQEIGDQNGVALAIEFMGWVAWCVGGDSVPEAIAAYRQALSIYRRIGERSRLSMCLGDLALALIDVGEYAEAQARSLEGLALTREMGSLDLMVYNLYCLGAASAGLGDFQAGLGYLRQSLQVAWPAHLPDHMAAALYYWAWLLAQESAAVDNQHRAKALELLVVVEGHPVAWQVFKERAARLQTQLEAELPAEVAATAKAEGKNKSIEAAVAEILQS